jgi:threonyl-tRNA synthetase
MFTEEEIRKINKSLVNQEFETQVGLYPDSENTHTLTFSFEIVGTRKMISVGEYYDYAFYDITILDVSDILKKYLSIVLEIYYQNKLEGSMKERLEHWFKKDSYILRGVNQEIDNMLGYYHTGDYTRSSMRDIYLSDKLVEEIQNTVIEK